MSTLFDLIVCLLQQFAELVAKGVVIVVNLVIVALAAAGGAIAFALPPMPSWPVADSGTWSWLNWVLPVASFVGVIGAVATLMISFAGLRLALNWVKAL